MKYVVKWIEFWDAEIEAETPEEAVAEAQERLCDSSKSELYDWGEFEINWEDTEQINEE